MRPFNFVRLLGGVVALAVLFTASAASAQSLSQQKRQELAAARGQSGSPFSLYASSSFTLNVNNWLCGLTNAGEICTNTFGSTTGGGGYWPIGTNNEYVFQAGLQLAARDPLNPANFVAAHCFNVSATNAGCRPLSDIFSSDNEADLTAWPETCNVWNPQTGEFVKTLSQLDTCVRYWDGDPAATVPGGHPMGIEIVQHTLAYTLEGFRDMIFFIWKVKNVSHTPLFRQANPSLTIPTGGWTLEDVYLAFGNDADVSASELDQNYGTFVPFLNDSTPLWLATIWVADFEAEGTDPYAQCGFCSVPGFVGTTFLRSPYNNTGAPITNAAAGRTIPPIDPVRLDSLRLEAARGDLEAQDTLRNYEIGQSFGSLTTRGGVFPDPTDAPQSWRYYSGNLNASERAQIPTAPPGFGFVDQPAAADTRYFHATGPFDLAPGDSAEVVVGLVTGAPVLSVPGFTPGVVVPHGLPGDTTRMIEDIMGRNVTTTAYPSLFKQVLDARTLFETNFLLPSPPPSPLVTAIPGDRQVSLSWSSDPVTFSDPYKPIADDRGIPNFREQDFEGFRVYRKVRPNDPWELIAQYDLANGIGPEITTTDSVQTIDGTWIAVRADTADFCVPRIEGDTEPVQCTVDTGLRFGLIDRGGQFPDPSNGPGLINGVTYFYTVTSFDINTPFAPGGSSLESGRRLSREPQATGAAAATPRSLASNYREGAFAVMVVGDDDQPLDPSATITIDPETGQWSGRIPPTNGFVTLVEPFIPELVTAGGDATVTIDSIRPGLPHLGGGATYFLTIDAPAGVQQVSLTLPIGFFGDSERNDATVGFDIVQADAEFENRFGVNPATLRVTGATTLSAPDNYFNSQIGRGWVNGATAGGVAMSIFNGPRWFEGATEPADPNASISFNVACPTFGECSAQLDHLHAGSVTGYHIYPIKSYFTTSTANRGLEGLLSTVRRAADIEVTWGANGAVTSVRDVTHNVDVPFDPTFNASWGFLTTASMAGVTALNTRDLNNAVFTPSDFTCVEPWRTAVVAGQGENAGSHCTSPAPATLQATAEIVPIDSIWAGNDTDAQNNAVGPLTDAINGFAMYINGEQFLFFGDQLPAAGTVWTLRTHVGAVNAVAVFDATVTDSVIGVNGYEYGAVVRPPNVPGLKAVIALTPTEIVPGERSVARVHTVPDPFIASAIFQTASSDRRIQFVNLPDRATIRIYSLSGVLVAAIAHDDPSGGGTAEWNIRNRNNQYVSSGVYFYHVSTPDGASKIGKFTIVQAP